MAKGKHFFHLSIILCSFFVVFNLGLLCAQEDKEEESIAEARRETEAAVAPKSNIIKREPLAAEKVKPISVVEAESAAEVKQPIVVNADKIEYSAGTKNVIATGNVEVDYKGSKLTAQKMVINTETKDAEAEGDARLEDNQGVKEGSKIAYNFETQKGTIVNAQFRSNPYFGRAEKIDKPGPDEFIIKKGFVGTCSFDRPHYRIGVKEVNYFPNDKIQTKGDAFYIGDIPLMYIPQYNHSLKDPLMHVQIVPGSKKEWGGYMLTTWRCNLNENINGRLSVDYRDRLGFAYGYGFNYDSQAFGKGDLKYYYTQEDPKDFEPMDAPNTEFQRALTRWRHKWVIATYTDFTAEFVKVLDSRRKNDINFRPEDA
ncbi:MAG: LptA/OstA family protein, partial [Candidatus Omnitrophota bacterium]|nr:LptA/OstA family protein [Candidatus Omnitrophota bacterium]